MLFLLVAASKILPVKASTSNHLACLPAMSANVLTS
jgi:hypothetical protein